MSDEQTQNKSPEPQPTEPVALPKKTSEEITLLEGKKVTVTKLKAGKFYEAQKIYTEWYKLVIEVIANKKGLNVSALVDKDGEADINKIQEMMAKRQEDSVDLAVLLQDNNNKVSDKKLELLSVALSMDVKEVSEEFYSEDIEVLVSKVIELNNFSDNLKNFAAPMVGLGA